MAGIALKSAENKGFPRALVLKNGGLGRFPNRRFVVEVTGFEPATFWSRSNLPQVHFIHLVLGNTA